MPINKVALITIVILHTHNVHPIINSCYAQLAHPIKIQHLFLWYWYDIIVHSVKTTFYYHLLTSSYIINYQRHVESLVRECIHELSVLIYHLYHRKNVLIAPTTSVLSRRNSGRLNFLVACPSWITPPYWNPDSRCVLFSHYSDIPSI